MADYFTHFSCLLDVGSPENAARALELHARYLDFGISDDLCTDSFLVSLQPDGDGRTLWMRDDICGDVENLIQFVILCAKELGLSGRWGFQYANTCSRAHINAFSGGAHVLELATGETIAWTDTDGWLAEVLNRGHDDA